MKVGTQTGNALTVLVIRVVKPHSRSCTAPPAHRGGHWRIATDEECRVALLRRGWSGDRRGDAHLFIPFRCNTTPGCEALILAPASHFEWTIEEILSQNKQ